MTRYEDGLDPLPTSVRTIVSADARRPCADPALRTAVLARLEASLGFAPAVTRPRRRAGWLRWAAVLGSLAAASATAVVLTHERPPTVEPLPSPAAHQAPSPAAPAVAPAPVAPPARRPVHRRHRVAPPVVAQPIAAPEPAPAPAPAPPVVANTVDLATERRLLEAARRALAGRNGSTALYILGEHARRHPEGWMAEERESMRVQALVLDRRPDDARSVAAAFRRRWPASIFGPVVEAALASIR